MSACAGRFRICLSLLSLLIVLSFNVFSQTSGTGALTGTVTDPSGASVANATVTVTSLATGQARTATTGADGSYKFGLLPPGNYRLRYEASGFKTVEVPSATVTVTETATLDRKLEVGAQTQEVTVQAETEAIQTTSSAMGSVVAGENVTSLPLASRNYTNLLSLSAGANANVSNAAQIGKATQETAVNGSATTQNNYQMDGASIVSYSAVGGAIENGSRGAFGIPNPDSLQEFKIQTSLYDAGYGRNPGANVNVVTKSGTNQFHGTAFEFLRNTVLNANDWFANHNGAKKGPLNQNQYGGTLGGPIKKDKLFFFVSYQQTDQKNGLSPAGLASFTNFNLPAGNRGTCPTGATALSQCDAATQAFVTALGANYANQGGAITSGFGGVTVKPNGSNINPVAIQIFQLKLPNGAYYLPTSAGASTAPGISCNGLNCTATSPAIYHEYQGMGNWDYIINPKNTLSGRYFVSSAPQTRAFYNGVTVPGIKASPKFNNHESVLKMTTVISNSVVNEARLSYQRNIVDADVDSLFSQTQVGSTPIASSFDRLFSYSVGNLEFGTPIFSITNNTTNQYQLADQISWTKGRHQFRFGAEGGYNRWNWNFIGLENGLVVFPSQPDFLLGLPGCAPGTFPVTCNGGNPGNTNGSIFSNIVATPNFATRYTPNGYIFHFASRNFSAFMQDDIKVSNRLTVNFGLRWEYDGFPAEQNGKNVNLNTALIPTTVPQVAAPCAPFPATCAGSSLVGFTVPGNWPNAIPAGVAQLSNNSVVPGNTSKRNFAPRVGFAWQPRDSSRFVVRGGFGYFYDLVSGENFIHGTLQSVPYAETVGGSGPAIAFASLQQPYTSTPANWIPRYVTATGASSNIGQPTIANQMPTPLTYSWNLNVQYEFLPSWVLELGYVGSRGTHQLISNYLFNAARLTPAAITGAAAGTGNVGLRVPYLGVAPGTQQYSDNGDMKFNSLQATVRKRLTKGLSMQGTYTLSQAQLTSWVGDPTVIALGDARDPIVSRYGPNPQYHPQRFTLQYSYDLPGFGLTGVSGKVLGGWRVSGQATIQNGTPLTVVDGGAGSIFGLNGASPAMQAQYAAGAGPGNVASSGDIQARIDNANGGYFNKAAFAATAPAIGGGTGIGNSGLGTILGPGQHNWDISLIKNTKVGGLSEGAALEFRTEFFNAFNHPQFSNPGNFDVTNAAFGKITSTSVNPRLIQFALKYIF